MNLISPNRKIISRSVGKWSMMVFSLCAFFVSQVSQGQGQGAVAPKQAGVQITPAAKNQAPMTQFENLTTQTLGVEFGQQRLALKAGEKKILPNPNQPLVDLNIAEYDARKNEWRMRYSSKIAPPNAGRFIPFPWAKPFKP